MTAKGIATVALSALTLGMLQTASAEDPHSFSANIGAVSNYMWRGVTQAQDGPAVQGGLDYAHASGFYAGTWVSNVDWNNEGASQEVIIPVDPATGLPATDADGNWIGYTGGSSNPKSPTYELDLYTGFGGKINDDLKWDLNAIYYAYPNGRDSDFAEIGGKLTYKWLTAGLAYTVYGQNDNGLFDNGDLYYFGALDFSLPYEFAFNVHGGYYSFTNSNGDSYGNWGATVSRAIGDYGTVSFNYDQNGGNDSVYETDPIFWAGWKKTF